MQFISPERERGCPSGHVPRWALGSSFKIFTTLEKILLNSQRHSPKTLVQTWMTNFCLGTIYDNMLALTLPPDF